MTSRNHNLVEIEEDDKKFRAELKYEDHIAVVAGSDFKDRADFRLYVDKAAFEFRELIEARRLAKLNVDAAERELSNLLRTYEERTAAWSA